MTLHGHALLELRLRLLHGGVRLLLLHGMRLLCLLRLLLRLLLLHALHALPLLLLLQARVRRRMAEAWSATPSARPRDRDDHGTILTHRRRDGWLHDSSKQPALQVARAGFARPGGCLCTPGEAGDPPARPRA